MNKSQRKLSIVFGTVGICAFGFVRLADAQTVTITPTQGQSAEQIEKDKAECTSIAQKTVASTPPPAPAATRGGAARGAARGAAVGAVQAERSGGEVYDRAPDEVKEEYRQEQARQGAAAGAAAGGAAQRRQKVQATKQQQASQNQDLDQAFRSCLMGRGYTVQ